MLQALEKKAGRTTQYYPGFVITSAQVMHSVDTYFPVTNKQLLEAIYEKTGDTSDISTPVTTRTVKEAIEALEIGASDEELKEILELLYDRIGDPFYTIPTSITAQTLKDEIDSLIPRDGTSNLELYNSSQNLYIAYNIGDFSRLPEDVSTLEVLRIIDCPDITTIPDIDSMTSLRVIDLQNTSISTLPSNVTVLETLRIVNCPNINDIIHLDEMKNLERIDLSGSTMKDLENWNSLMGEWTGDAPYFRKGGLPLLALQSKLAYIVMPDNYTSVAGNAFYECTKLKFISIPKCTTIDPQAFYNCKALQSIDLPNCTSIETWVFNGCTSLSSILLPDTFNKANFQSFNTNKITTLSIILRTPGGNNINTMCGKLNSGNFKLKSNSTLNVYLGSEVLSGVSSWETFIQGLFSLTKTGINSSWGSKINTANLYLNGTGLDKTTVSGYTGYPGIFTTIDYNTEQPYE